MLSFNLMHYGSRRGVGGQKRIFVTIKERIFVTIKEKDRKLYLHNEHRPT